MLAATTRKPVRTNVQPAFVTVRVAPETPWAECRLLLVRNRMGTSKKSNSCGSSPNRAKVRSAHSIPGSSQSHPVAELPPSYSGFGAGCTLFFVFTSQLRITTLRVASMKLLAHPRLGLGDGYPSYRCPQSEAGGRVYRVGEIYWVYPLPRTKTFCRDRRPQERDRHTTGSRSTHIYWHCALLWRQGEGEFSVQPQYLHQGQADENGPTFAQYRRERGELGCTVFFCLK